MAADKSAVKASAPAKSETKKASPKKAGKPNVFARIGGYLVGVRTELTRVVWPGRQEVLNSTVVVLVTLVFFAVLTTLVGFVASAAVTGLAQLAS